MPRAWRTMWITNLPHGATRVHGNFMWITNLPQGPPCCKMVIHMLCPAGKCFRNDAICLKKLNLWLRDDHGRTPLWIASFHGHRQLVSFLLKQRANPNKAANDGTTPLFAASQGKTVLYNNLLILIIILLIEGHIEVVKLLVAYQADPERKDRAGQNALHAASLNGNADVVKYLLITSRL